MTEKEKYELALFAVIRRDLKNSPVYTRLIQTEEQLNQISRELTEHVISTTDFEEAARCYASGGTDERIENRE